MTVFITTLTNQVDVTLSVDFPNAGTFRNDRNVLRSLEKSQNSHLFDPKTKWMERGRLRWQLKSQQHK
jgi:hypothetical protein